MLESKVESFGGPPAFLPVLFQSDLGTFIQTLPFFAVSRRGSTRSYVGNRLNPFNGRGGLAGGGVRAPYQSLRLCRGELYAEEATPIGWGP